VSVFHGELINRLPSDSFVPQLLANVEKIIDGMHYFPEYTLHDEYHINEVLRLAYELIPHDTMSKLNGQSINILISAIAIHDLGMFIMKDGLEKLLFGEHKDCKTRNLDHKSWSEQWHDFYRKARRWDGRKLLEIFGNDDSSAIKEERTLYVETGLDNHIPKEDTINQRLLYGEFLRQNHARLAFDITQFKFPGSENIDIFENCECDHNIKDMIGLVARSHGFNLRDKCTNQYLKNHTCKPHMLDIQIFYLMAILRMADYLHIGKERANEARRMKSELKSTISNREFELNQAVYNLRINPKKRLVYIELDGDLKKGSIYIQFKETLHKIQKELDMCWAVLADKYPDYALSVQRVTSNIHDKGARKQFNERFITKKVELKGSFDMMPLLVKPFYSGDPTFGVRELIQNSVDACNERKIQEKDSGFIGQIDVHVDTEKMTFEISDNGIGMNEDVLINYFLIAGSSYRYSEAWQDKYTDADGNAKFARNGRFGVGSLASFLIGDDITVTTRHKDDLIGFCFTYAIEPGALNVTRINAEIGTKITIKLNEEAKRFLRKYDYNSLSKSDTPPWYHWYYSSTPKINYFLNEEQIGENDNFLPQKKAEKNNWYDIDKTGFTSMKFTVSKNYNYVFILNGIIINDAKIHYPVIDGYGFKLDFPSGISIEDTNNKLNTNLIRTHIINFPEHELQLIRKETYKYYLAQLLAFNETDKFEIITKHKFFDKYFAVCNQGFTVCSPSFIYHTEKKEIFLLFSNNPFYTLRRKLPLHKPLVIINNKEYGKKEVIDIDGDTILHKNYEKINEYQDNDTTDYEDYDDYDDYDDSMSDYNDMPRYYDNDDYDVDISDLDDDVVAVYDISGSGCKKFWAASNIDNGELKSPPFGLDLTKEIDLIVQYAPENPCNSIEKNLMLEVLREYLPVEKNKGWIPFDKKERINTYRKAFSELKKYMPEDFFNAQE